MRRRRYDGIFFIISWMVWSQAAAQQSNSTTTTLIVTSQVLGAAYPVDSSGTECAAETYLATPCACFGGAARRAAFLEDDDVVGIDMGGYFFGSGLFYETFEGGGSARLFKASGYAARGLNSRDFSVDDSALASHLNASGVPTVASNFNATFLDDVVVPFAVSGGVAVASLLDDDAGGGNLLSFERSVIDILGQLQGTDELRVVLIPGGIPETDVIELLPAEGHEHEDSLDRQESAVVAIAAKFPFDVVVLDGSTELGARFSTPRIIESWLNGEVAVVATPAAADRGTRIARIRVMSRDGFYNSATVEEIVLDCDDVPREASRQLLDDLKAEVDADIATRPVGWIDDDLQEVGCIRNSVVEDDGGPECGCAVAECDVGNLAADAVRWLASTDVALVLGADLGDARIERYQVTAGAMLSVAPFLGDEIVVVRDVTGQQLKSVIEASFATELRCPTSRNESSVLQVSAGLEVTWFYDTEATPLLGDVFFEGTVVDDDEVFDVATSSDLLVQQQQQQQQHRCGAWLNNNNNNNNVKLGVPTFSAIVQYMSEVHGTPDSALVPSREYALPRISQLEDRSRVHVALLCGDDRFWLEHCDHAYHAITQIDNHHDGVFDDVLPNVKLTPHNFHIGCSEGRAYDGLVSLANQIAPDPISLVIAGCSNDVAEIGSVEARSRMAVDAPATGGDYVIISPGSTAPSLADDEAYPYVARITTPDSENGLGVARMAEFYGWGRVCVVHEDSLFATEMARAFVEKFRLSSPNFAGDEANEVLGGGRCVSTNAACELEIEDPITNQAVGISVSLRDFHGGRLNMTDVVLAVAETGAKIVLLAVFEALQEIYEAVSELDVNHGVGYAWISAFPSEDSLIDRATGETNNAAVDGAEGAVGFSERTPSYGEWNATTNYLDAWAEVSGLEGCEGDPLECCDQDRDYFCDFDGVDASVTGFGLYYADSVYLYASALHSLGETDATKLDPSVVYDRIKETAIDGATGHIVLEDASGDRLGVFDWLNLVVTYPSRNRRRKLSAVELQTGTAEFVVVGEYDAESDAVTKSQDVIFPGLTTNPPADRDPAVADGSSKNNNNNRTAARLNLIIFVLLGVIGSLCAAGLYAHYRRRTPMYDGDLDKLFRITRTFDPVSGLVQPLPKEDTSDYGREPPSRERSQDEKFDQRSEKEEDDEEHVVLLGRINTTAAAAATEEPPQPRLPHLARQFAVDAWYWLGDDDDDDAWHPYDEDLQNTITRAWRDFHEQVGHFLDDDENPSSRNLSSSSTFGGGAAAAAAAAGTPILTPHNSIEFELDGGAKHKIVFSADPTQVDFAHINTETFRTRPVKRRPLARRVSMTWYFEETPRKTQAEWEPEPEWTIPPLPGTAWRAFSDRAQPALSAAYASWLAGFSEPQVYLNDEWNRTSQFDAFKCYEVNVQTLVQTRVASGFERPIKIVFAKPPPTEATAAAELDGRLRATARPDRVGCDACLPLEIDDVVALKTTLGGGDVDDDGEWGLGVVVSDKTRRTPAGAREGYFPLACATKLVDLPAIKGLEAFRQPRWWDVGNGEPVQRRTVMRDSDEWRAVSDGFHLDDWSIHDVERIQDVFKWQQYGIAVSQVRKRSKTTSATADLFGSKVWLDHERVPVYHGTRRENVDKIIKGGFKPGFASPEARYGRGAYFAVASQRALFAQWATPDDDGIVHVFLCRIVSGKYRRGANADKDAGEDYDTTVDDTKQPQIFVTYDVQQAYPLYYVQLKNNLDPVSF
ncbi:hypothetical protein CTAYLR_003794 [Chrysophaeum taylorii]|uniref:Poly [ADP-ribose] polymerase n=1 Tax=Chrysophaeum taylorii TaxID=2483200 RepID=A0AAD7UEU3_9STRA|nr:hypothetical protein CTAYLR_003794 [Chrysophaeum taylorii]